VALINQFELEGGKKTLRHRIIPAVAFTAHAAQHTVRRQQLLNLTGVLAAAVRVMQQALRRSAENFRRFRFPSFSTVHSISSAT
jgi:hypothetical protein